MFVEGTMDAEHHAAHHKHHEEHHEVEKEHERRHGSTGRWLRGFIFGAVAGAVTCLLVAPQSGEQTRELIRYRTAQAKLTARQKAEEARTQVQTLSDRSREYVDETRGRVTRVAHAVKQAAKESWQEAGSPRRPSETQPTEMVQARM